MLQTHTSTPTTPTMPTTPTTQTNTNNTSTINTHSNTANTNTLQGLERDSANTNNATNTHKPCQAVCAVNVPSNVCPGCLQESWQGVVHGVRDLSACQLVVRACVLVSVVCQVLTTPVPCPMCQWCFLFFQPARPAPHPCVLGRCGCVVLFVCVCVFVIVVVVC